MAVTLAGSLALATFATAPALASSHREAPLISQDPVADNTDLYAFRDPVDSTKVDILAGYIGLEQPAGGPNFAKFGDDVLYEIHINNTGGATDDVTYQFRFRTQVQNPNTFLYNTGPIASPADANFNVQQVYSVQRIDRSGSHMLLANQPTPPVNIGPRSTPNYETKLAQPTVAHLADGSAFFAGQRKDPFFVDLGSIFDLLGLRPFNGAHAIPEPTPPMGTPAGVDGLAGLNVHVIAMQLPITAVSRNANMPTTIDDPASVIGVYAAASRQRVRVLDLAGGAPRNAGRWVQVSRLGLPLVNEVLIPLGLKDHWNSVDPKDDAQFFPNILDPEPAKLIPVLYPGVKTPQGGFDASGNPRRTDIVAVLRGAALGLSTPNLLPPADLLRLNLATPTSSPGSFTRLGFLGPAMDGSNGNADGFPNGRRLGDDVVDILVRLLAGGTALSPDPKNTFDPPAPNKNLSQGIDGVPLSTPLMSTFPYAPTPIAGYCQQAPNPSKPAGQPTSPPC